MLRRITLLILLTALGGCGASGSSSVPASTLPAKTKSHSGAIRHTAAVSTAPVLIDAGGGATGAWSADADFNGGWIPAATTHSIDTSHVTSPAPQAVYQTTRVGNMTYAVTGLTPGAPYTVRLHFDEPYWPGPGMRQFNVAINGSPVLTNFDIYKDSGGEFIADIKSFAATADGNGTIAIVYTTLVDQALAAGIEIDPAASSTPTTAAASLLIDSGGGASGTWQADTDFTGGWIPAASANAIDTSRVTSPAPQSVYQSDRVGNFSYTLPNLTPGTAYTVRLHMAETYWPGPGMRLFNVAINGVPALTNFDLFKDSGGENIADVKSFSATASSSGTISITFTTVMDNALIAGIEVDPSGSSSPTAPPATPTSAPTPVWNGSSERPRSADSFVDTVGINTHLCTPGSLYDVDFATISGLLKNSGIRHIRDTMTLNAWQPYYTRLSQLASYGIHGDMITGIGEPISDLSSFVAAAPGVVELVEAPAEYDRTGGTWAADLAAYQQTLYTGIKATPGLSSLGVLGPALAEFNYAVIGNLAGSMDYGNLHDYFGSTNPGQPGTGYGSIPYWITNEQPMSGNDPIMTTETGYQDVASQPDAVTPAVKVRYSMRTLLEQYNANIVRTYFYEFLDELGQNYGFLDASLNPKPVYTAIASMLGDLNDPGAISLAPLSYTLTADPSVHHTLLQKRDGTYRLFLWVNVTAEDPAIPIQSVTLTFPSTLTSISQKTWQDNGTATTTNLTQSNNAVTFAISDRVSEIKIQH